MNELELSKLQYPIGKFKIAEEYTTSQISEWINTIANFSEKMKKISSELNETQLETPYRPNGWTARQVIHHCADSHMNAFIRFKLALTEDKPTVKAYEEQLWAEQPDYKLPVESSLKILEGLHLRWSILLASLSNNDFESKYIHPQSGKELDLYFMLSLYAWHCEHHLGHLNIIKG